MKRSFNFFLTACFCMALALAGCAHKNAPTQEQIESQGEKLKTLARSRSVAEVDAPYLGARAIPITRDESVLGMRVTLRAKGSLESMIRAVGDMTSLSAYLSVDEPDTPAPKPVSSASVPGRPAPELADMLGASPDFGSGAAELDISYEGPLRGLLDQIAAQSGYGWDYDDKAHAIVFAHVMTRTFTLLATPGVVSHDDQITNKSKETTNTTSLGNAVNQTVATGDMSSQTSQTNKNDLKYNAWADTERVVKSMLSKRGSVVTNQSAGTITVRDKPENIRQIAAFIRETNIRLSRQVALNVRVWSLEVTDDTEAGLDLQVLFQNNDVALALGTIASADGLSTASATLMSGKLKDSRAVLKALKQWGNATQVTSGAVVTMNNQPAPVQAIRKYTYLASASISNAEYGQTTEITPGEVTTGFAMTVIPHILDQRKAILQYNINLSSLDEMDEFQSNGITVQLPRVSSRAFSQRTTMQMGQTLVLAGFQQETQSFDTSTGLLSLGRKAGYGKTLLVITIELESVGGGMEA